MRALRILGGWFEGEGLGESTWIDPWGTGSYNLMCSGSSLVLLPISWEWESGGSRK